ncbi:uncharacterized protein LOC129753821 [Uranotaenia lowii]|uniref:uncharacterized protein LOC129753821 n=1 Tax=Uranotaenia lowii TaxID=190385 RepID=UPI00247893C3|nr:uncharacterized protein LOC129753821 [Uranotaenia lowii]
MEVLKPENPEALRGANNNLAVGSGDKLEDGCTAVDPIKAMTSSIASLLDDTTPSDSGVQLLDSESSSGLNESMMSSTGGFEFEVNNLQNNNNNNNKISLESPVQEEIGRFVEIDIQNDGAAALVLEQLDPAEIEQAMTSSQLPDEMISSTCSTFDTENIVYRRKVKKTPQSQSKTPKKRVSFHEDILKNTKTDNIHIEHGFITYKKAGANKAKPGGPGQGRYSWCSEYGGGDGDHDDGFDYGDDGEDGENRQYVYRNACSDVLDYGKTDVFENIEDEKNYVKYDNSGIFEYGPPEKRNAQLQLKQKDGKEFYKCSCSDSNSSLDSGSSNDEGAKGNYKQAKSNSCECIGHDGAGGRSGGNNNNIIISDNCYYSEPNIEHLDAYNGNNVGGERVVKSVWSKEKKPKSSCLKKTKRNQMYTDIVVPEYDLSKKVKKFNVHQRLSVIDNSKMIFGSLKDIFGISLPERGVPEGSEDSSTVRECIPESNEQMIDDFTVVQKPKNFLSKSLDGGFNSNKPAGVKKYVHNVDEQLRRKNDEDLFAPSRKNSVEDEQEEQQNQKKQYPLDLPLDESQQPKAPYRNKFIVNGESTVFEHTGVSYCFEDEEGKSLDDESSIGSQKDLPIGESTSGSFIGKTQIKKKLSNIFQKINVIGSNATTPSPSTLTAPPPLLRQFGDGLEGAEGRVQSRKASTDELDGSVFEKGQNRMESSTISSAGSDHSSSILSDSKESKGAHQPQPSIGSINSPRGSISKNRHLSSPARKKSLTTRMESRGARMSPDLFGGGFVAPVQRHLNIVDRQLLSEEFDDILTVTTTTTNDTDKEGSDIVILDYPSTSSTPTPQLLEEEHPAEKMPFPMPPPSGRRFHNPMTTSQSSNSSSKSSLINRFLRNVTQKKILEANEEDRLEADSGRYFETHQQQKYPATIRIKDDMYISRDSQNQPPVFNIIITSIQ